MCAPRSQKPKKNLKLIELLHLGELIVNVADNYGIVMEMEELPAYFYNIFVDIEENIEPIMPPEIEENQDEPMEIEEQAQASADEDVNESDEPAKEDENEEMEEEQQIDRFESTFDDSSQTANWPSEFNDDPSQFLNSRPFGAIFK